MHIEESDDGTVTVTFVWHTRYGRCYDCNLPAAYAIPGLGIDFRLCSVCAADHAAGGDEIVRLEHWEL